MNSDDFEKRLESQPLRRIPSEWRKQILPGTKSSPHSSFTSRHSFLSTLHSQLSTILWPNPKAWAGLAAVWMLIFAIQFETKNQTPLVATVSASARTQTVTMLKDQQKILAELMDNAEPRDVDKPRRLPNQPHSELREPFSMA